MNNITYEKDTPFISTLRSLMEETNTSQRTLAAYMGIRSQSISYYLNGETQPNIDKILKMAEYFGVSTDYLLTGKKAEYLSATEATGLSQTTIENIRLIKDDYFEDCGALTALLDRLLGDKDFYLMMQKACDDLKASKRKKSEDQIEFHRWKAMQCMIDYFEEFLGDA